MQPHRFREQMTNLIPPSPVSGPPASVGFMMCPAGIAAWIGVETCWVGQQIYQLAFQQAQAVVRPSRMERWMACEWN